MPVCARALAFVCASLVALVLASAPSVVAPAFADAGTVYSCTVVPSYQHPVTGVIEDPGGAAARATGQAMADSCVSSTGMMEITDAGECFLTIRMSLVDLTSGHTFNVQSRGDAGWTVPAMGVTATGQDANGTTNDVCLQLPAANGIARVSMYVESMGREVIFYVHAEDLGESAPAGFVPAIVTEPSGGGATVEQPVAQELPEAEEESEGEAGQAQAAGASQVDVAAAGDAAITASAATATTNTDTASVASADDLVEGAGAATAQGLSLSTARSVASDQNALATPGLNGANASFPGPWLFIAVGCIVLVAVAVGVVYAFRRTGDRLSGEDPDDYSQEYLHD